MALEGPKDDTHSKLWGGMSCVERVLLVRNRKNDEQLVNGEVSGHRLSGLAFFSQKHESLSVPGQLSTSVSQNDVIESRGI